MKAWQHTRGLLAMFICGFRSDQSLSTDEALDAANERLDSITRPGQALAYLREYQPPAEVEWQVRTRVHYAWRPSTEAEAARVYRFQPNLVRCVTVVDRVPKESQ